MGDLLWQHQWLLAGGLQDSGAVQGALMSLELQAYVAGIEKCVKVPLPDARFVALTSFSYNVGVEAACGFSAVKLINESKTAEVCEALLKWNSAAGIVFPGLTRRSQKESQFCIEFL